MSWVQKLYETYENSQSEVGVRAEDNNVILLPVGHILQKAQIEIILDQNGQFKKANRVSKEDAATIIPCSEESGGRSGRDPKCHPLCDKLQYLAKDLIKYIEKTTPEYQAKQAAMHQQYCEQLTKWCESEFSHPKIRAVLAYIQKGTVTKDLVESGVLSLEKDGKLKPKNANDFIRWLVYIPGDMEEKVWRDKDLFEKWIKFDAAIQNDKRLCYITGKEIRIAKNHPKYIRVPGDSAKIISSNDSSGYTYRGRFLEAEQACCVGYEVSQKAHNALRWLIGKQGKVFFQGKKKEPGFTVVAWSTSGEMIPDPLSDSYSIIEIDSMLSETDSPAWTAQEFAIKLNKKITGYKVALNNTQGIVIMAVDSATLGRMAISFYRELTGSDFLSRIENWHVTCCWIHKYRPTRFVGAPAPKDIAEAAYGKRADDKLRKATIERILPCIIDGLKLPRDIMESAVRRASNRIGLEDWEWEKTLSIACALYKKYYEKEEFDVALDESRNTRDYLFGRLLALADSLEDWALKEAGEDRPTNAARLMQRFANHPYTTWQTLELALGPYKTRLGNKSLKRQNMISRVVSMFEPDDFLNDKKLSGEFLLGYHCQRESLWTKGSNKNNNDGGM